MNTKPYVLGFIQCTYTCAPSLNGAANSENNNYTILRDAIRDQAWETFGVPALESYFACGIEKFYAALDDFANQSIPFTEEAEVHLLFMIDALIHARRLIGEVR